MQNKHDIVLLPRHNTIQLQCSRLLDAKCGSTGLLNPSPLSGAGVTTAFASSATQAANQIRRGPLTCDTTTATATHIQFFDT